MATVADFKQYVETVEKRAGYTRPLAFGLGIRKSKGDKTLEVFFPSINYNKAFGTAAVLQDVTHFEGNQNGYAVLSKANLQNAFDKFAAFHNEVEQHPNITLIQQLLNNYQEVEGYQKVEVIAYFLFDKDQAVENAVEGYFKVQCLSQLHVQPHGINCSGIFGKMNNIAWTNKGPILPEDIAEERIKATFQGEELVVSHVDKFPYLVSFGVPEGVRVVSGSQARLGAHLSPGTTIMPAGYVNFNAGTLGSAMIEGRVSGGVVVGNQSDVGGGASIMGTLSGGNKNVISIGEKCLLGANAGTGISLGDGCTVAAGVYITAASKVSLYNKDKQPVDLSGKVVAEGKNVVKGMELNGKSYMLYYNDSQTGKLTARPNTKLIALNESLHV
ncbi:MAG: tetrahydrodipicolinate N-succinyltransferase N-terminal domain-containing protein [Bacteroidota bacterium]